MAAIASFAAVLLAGLVLVLLLLSDPLTMVGAAASLAVAVAAAWNAITRRGAARLVSAALAVVAVVVWVVVLVAANNLLALFASLGLAVAAVALARYSLERDRASLISAPTPGVPVPAAGQPVLIMNLKSGGGKAEKFKLADECRARGIEPVVLQPGDDLLQLAEAAIERGADVIGMAGGDGSQALVASIAAQRGVAHVVVPAGTRNHFALDLGLDRDDVLGALDAFGPAVERRIDLAEVNGRVFVNNVSLGVYGQITQSEEYRDAKVATTLDQLPTLLGPGGKPMDLGWTGPDGVHHDSAHLIQVSNNRYSLRVGGGAGTRDCLDDGKLGILAVEVSGTGAAVELAALVALRRPDGARALEDWTAPSFEVTSGAPVAAGVDGEAMELDSPLRFRILPGALRVRLPEKALGYAPAAIAGQSAAATLGNVWRVARGHVPHPPSA
jgi:diacylglycerol kinase family enzyme